MSYLPSNIWGFFKHKVENYIDKNHKNILIVLTDGYLYDVSNKGLEKNNEKTNFTTSTIKKLGLNNINWENRMQDKKIGILPANENLNNLEVLVIGLNPNTKSQNPYEVDVMNKLWGDWFNKMGIKKFKIETADLPTNLDQTIKNFITQ